MINTFYLTRGSFHLTFAQNSLALFFNTIINLLSFKTFA